MDIKKNINLVGRFFTALKLGLAKNKVLDAVAAINILAGAANVLAHNYIISALNFGASAALVSDVISNGYKTLRRRENFWATAFSPTPDLPAATSALPLPSGARGQRLNREP